MDVASASFSQSYSSYSKGRAATSPGGGFPLYSLISYLKAAPVHYLGHQTSEAEEESSDIKDEPVLLNHSQVMKNHHFLQ